jgi:hypothetical protein
MDLDAKPSSRHSVAFGNLLGDAERFKDRLTKLVKHKPVEKPD